MCLIISDLKPLLMCIATSLLNIYVINEEQAETVRMIYDLYLQGYGSMKIAKILTERKRKTASGLTKWSVSNIMRAIKNATYTGTKCYNKSRSNNFLEQKRINNLDMSTYEYVKATFTAEGRKKNCIIKLEEIEKISSVHREKNEDNAHFIKNPHIFTYLHRQLLRSRETSNCSFLKIADLTIDEAYAHKYLKTVSDVHYFKTSSWKDVKVSIYI